MQLRFHSFPLNCSNVHFSYQRRRAADGELALRLQNLLHSVIIQKCHNLPASCPHSTLLLSFCIAPDSSGPLEVLEMLLQHLDMSEGGPRAWKFFSHLNIFICQGKKNRFNYNAQQSWCLLHGEYISGARADPSQRRSSRLPFGRYKALVSFCIPLMVFPE